jgi:signal transduction histidine kinase
VADDGAGFDPNTVTRHGVSGHFGLVALRDLVESVGGTVTLDSAPDRGTRVQLEIPIR